MRCFATASAIWATSGIALVPECVSAQQQPMPSPPSWYDSHMMEWGAGWFGMVLGPLFVIFILAVAIALAILLVRWVGGPWHTVNASPNVQIGRHPIDILRERYARGEISKEEFLESRRVLNE